MSPAVTVSCPVLGIVCEPDPGRDGEGEGPAVVLTQRPASVRSRLWA